MDASNAKLLIALTIFVISFFSSVAPIKVINVDDRFFSIGNLLASGVLLAGGLVHQLPDAMDNLAVVGSSTSSTFPLAAFLSGLTFCLFLILEEHIHTQFEDSFHGMGSSSSRSNIRDYDNDDGDGGENPEGGNWMIHHHNHHSTGNGHTHPRPQHGQSAGEIPEVSTSEGAYLLRPNNHNYTTNNNNHNHNDCNNHQSCCPHDKTTVSTSMVSVRNKSNRPTSVLETFRDTTFVLDHPIHHHDEHLAEHMQGSLLAAIILLLALSVHSILEGLAIGVARDMSQIYATTAAVVAHKAFAGYALGSSMVASQMKEGHFLVLCGIFALCSVAGVFMGMVFEQFGGSDNRITTGIIQAMVSGTFLYVSIVEIGMKEIMMHRTVATTKKTTTTTTTTTDDDNDIDEGKQYLSSKTLQFLKLGAFLLGYTLFSILAIWV
jgi:zinc transporter ZupT